VVVLLIAHPTKMKKDDAGVYNTPSLYDVSGSADFRNQTHNGFAIHRYFEDEKGSGYTKFINLKTKFQFQGNIGAESSFNYDVDNSRYYGHDCPRHEIDLTLEDIGDTVQPNLDFETSAKEIIHQKKIDRGDYDIIEDDDLPF
jgi:twinkle protein